MLNLPTESDAVLIFDDTGFLVGKRTFLTPSSFRPNPSSRWHC
jgi:hypothetical protein